MIDPGPQSKIVGARARIWNVGQDPWMFPTLQAAIDSINADPTPPSLNNRCMIRVWPGRYEMTAQIEVPSWTTIRGISNKSVQLYNETTNMFLLNDRTAFEDLLIEGSSNTSICTFEGNNASHVSIRRVLQLHNSGNNKQQFINQTGATWVTWLIEDCINDWYALSGYQNVFENSSGASRDVDLHFTGVFFDALQLTSAGYQIAVRGVHGVHVVRSTLRGAATHHTGVRVELGGVTGTPTVTVRHSFLSGGTPVHAEAGCHYNLYNSDAVGSTCAGTRTVRRSALVTPLNGYFGGGADGAIVFDGSATFGFASKSGSVYTLNRTITASSVTIDAGVTVKANGFRILCNGRVTINGTWGAPGNDAVGATAGAATGTNEVAGGQAGANGGIGAGANGTSDTTSVCGNGGAGGAGAGGAGGTGVATALAVARGQFRAWPACLLGVATGGAVMVLVGAGSGGGAGGGNGAGKEGGAGGSGGGAAIIVAQEIVIGATGVITVKGGNGGNAVGAGNSGGGGGGAAGWISLIYASLVNNGTIILTGGTGGAKTGTGVAGSNGADGPTIVSMAVAA